VALSIQFHQVKEELSIFHTNKSNNTIVLWSGVSQNLWSAKWQWRPGNGYVSADNQFLPYDVMNSRQTLKERSGLATFDQFDSLTGSLKNILSTKEAKSDQPQTSFSGYFLTFSCVVTYPVHKSQEEPGFLSTAHDSCSTSLPGSVPNTSQWVCVCQWMSNFYFQA